MRTSIVLLFLANFVFSVACLDKFVFEVSFICRYNQREKYHYKVQFVEWDWWLFNRDDVITELKIGEAPSGTVEFTMFGVLNGDEITSEGYDVRMLVSHDCTENQKEVDIYMYIKPQCEIGKGICHFKISKDITNTKGEVTNYANLVY